MNLADRILHRIHGFLQKHEEKRPEPVGRICMGCRQRIEGSAIIWENRPWCSWTCIPSVERRAREAQ